MCPSRRSTRFRGRLISLKTMHNIRKLLGLTRWSMLVLTNCGLRTGWSRRRFHSAVSILKTWLTCWKSRGKRLLIWLLPTRSTRRNLFKLRATCIRRGTSWIWLKLGCLTVGGGSPDSTPSNILRNLKRTGRRARRIRVKRKVKVKRPGKLLGKEIIKDLSRPDWVARFL